MKRWGTLIGCLLLVMTTVGCPWEHGGGGDDDHYDGHYDEDIDVSEYADFQSGGSWHFHGDDPDNSLTLYYDGLQAVQDYSGSVHVLRDDGGRLMYFAQDLSDKLYLVGTSDGGKYDEGLPLLRSSFDPWETYGPYETDDSDCRSYVTYQRTSVSVPYDYYDRAVLTTVTTECKGFPPDTTVTKYWFGKDTGLVKLFDADRDTWYLEDRD